MSEAGRRRHRRRLRRSGSGDRDGLGPEVRHRPRQGRVPLHPGGSRGLRYGSLRHAPPNRRTGPGGGASLDRTQHGRGGGGEMGLLQPPVRARGAAEGGARDGGVARLGPHVRAHDDQNSARPGVGDEPRSRHRIRSPGAGDLHADRRFREGLSRLRRQGEASLRRELMTDDFLEWPFFDERHRALRTRLRPWVRDHLAGIDDSDDRKACKVLVERLAAGGFLDYSVPKSGNSLDVRSLCVIRETLAHHHGLADFAFALQGLGSAPITLAGSDELKERYLPSTREGRFIAAFALSEPEAGSDVGAIATTAKRDGDDFVLDGTKTWISNGGLASYYVVFARSETAPGTKGLSAFVVDADAPGFRVAQEIEVVAPHPLARLSFEGCRVPRPSLRGEPGQGFEIAMATLDIFRASVGAAALGFARRALDEARAARGA